MSYQNETSATSASNTTNSESEPTFSIQPHPATTNDPQDLQRNKESGGGSQTSGSLAAHFVQGPGPVIPNSEMLQNIGEPLSKEELRVRTAELNK